MPRHDAVAEAPLTPSAAATRADAALAAALGDGVDVERVATTGSTNADLLARVRAGAGAPRIVVRVADEQTAGRGRLGRAWRSSAGRSLTFSCSAPFARSDLSGLSLAVGAAVADALDALGSDRANAPRLGLKWPNDLCLVDHAARTSQPPPWRKLGGILIETAPARGCRVAVVGVGINLCAPVAAHALPYDVGALDERLADADADRVLVAVAPALIAALAAFESHGLDDAARTRFAARDVLRGRVVRTGRADAAGELPADAVEGVAAGIDRDGALLLRLHAGPGVEGRTTAVTSGEVSVRPIPQGTMPC